VDPAADDQVSKERNGGEACARQERRRRSIHTPERAREDARRQLLRSLLDYAASEEFRPTTSVGLETISRQLWG
jgi:hypothetical protein